MKVLVVGAGAVGQVYGLCLQRGGADLWFWTKPKYRAEAEAGYTLYDLRARDKTAPVRLEGFGVLDSLEELAAHDFDAVVLTVSSTALRGGWLEDFLAALPGVLQAIQDAAAWEW